jgi:peptide/nickel transport system ATP-binding protein
VNNLILQPTKVNQSILRTEKLKAFYVLDMHGTQKVVKAVNEVDLEVQENEVYGIAGESGCGKTTLLKAIFGAVDPPLRLLGGHIFYFQNSLGIDVSSLSIEEKRKLRMGYISYVPQGSMSVLNPVLKLKKTYGDFVGSHVSGKSRQEAQYPGCLSPPVVGWHEAKGYHRPGSTFKAENHHCR